MMIQNPDGEWHDFIRNGLELTIEFDSLFFKKNDKNFYIDR